ncbi:hypothetical protein A0H81_07136 [Grifola frondosa]|uniref:Uncharacterized protein n=1 Tax=Grifola frondosa TaxID=5627 RepID=A0A1C7M971_GRIFR|nr:hypothetical protein A0H81_07136 [Grifola frondosa]
MSSHSVLSYSCGNVVRSNHMLYDAYSTPAVTCIFLVGKGHDHRLELTHAKSWNLDFTIAGAVSSWSVSAHPMYLVSDRGAITRRLGDCIPRISMLVAVYARLIALVTNAPLHVET